MNESNQPQNPTQQEPSSTSPGQPTQGPPAGQGPPPPGTGGAPPGQPAEGAQVHPQGQQAPPKEQQGGQQGQHGPGGGPAAPPTAACDPEKTVSDMKTSYEKEKAKADAAQKKVEKMKADLDDLGKMSQEIEDLLKQHATGQADRDTKFRECDAYVTCKKDIVDGTVQGATKAEVDKITKDYWDEVHAKEAECQHKDTTLTDAEKARKAAEDDEQNKKKIYDDDKALVDKCLAECDELKKLFEEAEETCSYRLMYFVVGELETVVDRARTTCLKTEDFKNHLCVSWDELRAAKAKTGDRREQEAWARQEAEQCHAELTELTKDPRGTLVDRINAAAAAPPAAPPPAAVPSSAPPPATATPAAA